MSIVPSRNISCLWVLSTCLSAARNLSSFQLLPAFLITDRLQLFFGLPLFLFPWGFQSRAAFGTSPSSFLNVWPTHLNFLFFISKFISSCPVTFHRSLLEIIFGHHILSIYLRHLFTRVCILHWISFVTSLCEICTVVWMWNLACHKQSKCIINHKFCAQALEWK